MNNKARGSRPLISVIIPVFNQKDHLRRCVDSVIAQTYDELDIILVDDGSGDGSGDICDGYALQDTRIRVVHQTNQGLSAARNSGLDIARGEFIAFVDSDDEILPPMIQTLLEVHYRTGAGIAACGFYNIEPEDFRNVEKIIDDNKKPAMLSDDEISVYSGTDMYWCKYHRWITTVVQWNKLFARSIFDDLRYPVGRLHEDEFIILYELEKAGKYAIIDRELYVYYRHPDTITRSEMSAKRQMDIIDGYLEQLAFFIRLGDRELIKQSFAVYKYNPGLIRQKVLFGDGLASGIRACVDIIKKENKTWGKYGLYLHASRYWRALKTIMGRVKNT